MKQSIVYIGRFYLLSPFVLAILGGLWFWRDWEVRAALIILAAPLTALMLMVGALSHYLAPAFGALLIIGALGLQRLGRSGRAGPILIAAFVGISASWCVISIRADAQQVLLAPTGIRTRPLLIDRLERQGGRHLVIVHYRPDHDVHAQWVYNRADIDSSDIVWAQDMGPARNRELLDYYRDRKIWLLEPDIDPLKPIPYSGSVTF